ncbi:hypothetical protein WI23_29495 [Burkholderia oklahomensis C6786]|nr:hypothetical protein WI23_29495 [Burkholderia oklahomensis C6786]
MACRRSIRCPRSPRFAAFRATSSAWRSAYDACFDIAIGLAALLAGVIAKFADTPDMFAVGRVACGMAIHVYRSEAALHPCCE